MMNTLKTTVLLAGMTALFMGVGYLIGGNSGMVIAFLFALGTNVFAYWNSDKMVLSMQNAHPIDEHSMPEYVEMVAQLAANARIPMPRLYIIETDQPNAFATGRNPANGVVAVSSGLLRYMNNEEVAAVVAHEIAHIKNHDTLTMTITATLAGAISMLAQWGMFFGGGNRENNNGGGIIGAIAMMILAPIAASVVQMAVSRTREYEADKDGAMICGQPLALASALQKIQAISQQVHNPAAERNPAMAHMYISNPLSGARMDNLFSTHPDTENRVNALVAMANSMGEPISSGYRPRQSASSVRNNKQQSSTPSWRAPSTVEKPNDDDNNRGPWGNL